jgi:hypothetical protein
VQKAAKQRQLSLAPVVREAIVRQVEKNTPEEATAASKITKYVGMCKEKLPVIEEQLQTALAASRYCSDVHPQEMQPAVMVAVLDGVEVAAAVQKELARAEKQAAAQAEAATRAKSDQEPRWQQHAPAAATAGGPRVTAPQEEIKPAQAVWDTSDLSGSLERAAYNPYAVVDPATGVLFSHTAEVLITAESSISVNFDAIQAAFGGAANAEVRRNISVSELGRLLDGRTTWCSGHGDAMLQSEPVLAFAGEGGAIEVVSMATLVDTVRPHVLTGKLELIVLTGDCTARLAAKLRELAFVPYVVCWETVLNDEVGHIFFTAFAQAVAPNANPNPNPGPNLTLTLTLTLP